MNGNPRRAHHLRGESRLGQLSVSAVEFRDIDALTFGAGVGADVDALNAIASLISGFNLILRLGEEHQENSDGRRAAQQFVYASFHEYCGVSVASCHFLT